MEAVRPTILHASSGVAILFLINFTGSTTFLTKFSLQGIAKDVLFPLLPQFTQAFVEVLAMSDSPTVDCGLKMEVLKVSF